MRPSSVWELNFVIFGQAVEYQRLGVETGSKKSWGWGFKAAFPVASFRMRSRFSSLSLRRLRMQQTTCPAVPSHPGRYNEWWIQPIAHVTTTIWNVNNRVAFASSNAHPSVSLAVAIATVAGGRCWSMHACSHMCLHVWCSVVWSVSHLILCTRVFIWNQANLFPSVRVCVRLGRWVGGRLRMVTPMYVLEISAEWIDGNYR